MIGSDLTTYVNPRYGVDNEGNTVIGPTRPNGSVNPSPDTASGKHSGYVTGNRIRGFSQIHASGTGYGKYGEFLISPQIGLEYSLTGHDSGLADETATCCEYSVTLTDYNIRCAVTPAHHSSIYKFTYPASENASLLIDMAHSVPLLAGIVNESDGISSSDVTLNIDTSINGQTILYGSGTYAGGFGPKHTLHFYAVVNKQAKSVGIYDADGLTEGKKELVKQTLRSKEESVGGYLRFNTEKEEEILLKIGVSFTSAAKAKKWLDEEIPHWDYDAVKAETKALWNAELQKIKISGKDLSDGDLMLFYTALYHTMCMPRDRSGDIPGYSDDTPMIDDHYAIWDTWRTLYPLYALIKPELVAKTVNSFIARYEKHGFVRDSFIGGKEMYPQQGGDDIDNVIADAYVKKIAGIDWRKAYEVVKNHADNYRIGWYSYEKPCPDKNAPYYVLGYIPDDYTIPGTAFGQMSCSYTLEQAYNDFCAATLAKELGSPKDYETYLARSSNWTNLWNPDAKYNEFCGFIMPKNSDGTWVAINPGENWGSWAKHFYEATSYNYSFFVPHDIPQLMEKCGGKEAFARRLLYGIETGLVDYGNEPAFLASYLFAYTDKPYLITDCIDKLRDLFTLEGPPGNDDSGAMSSWYILSSIGFFPNAGQNIYFLTSPRYEHTVITLGNGKEIIIKACNLSKENKYIQSVKINNVPWHSAIFSHNEISDGAIIEFEMGADPVQYTQMP